MSRASNNLGLSVIVPGTKTKYIALVCCRDMWLSRRSQLSVLGPWDLCAASTCSQEIGLVKDACLLQCVNDAHDASGSNARQQDEDRSDLRRQVDALQSCIQAKCARGNMDCVYAMCLAAYKWNPNLKTRGVLPESLGPNEQLNGEDNNGSELQTRMTYGVGSKRTLPSRTRNSDSQKRSWENPIAACIDYHCSKFGPNTLEYHVCFKINCSRWQADVDDTGVSALNISFWLQRLVHSKYTPTPTPTLSFFS